MAVAHDSPHLEELTPAQTKMAIFKLLGALEPLLRKFLADEDASDAKTYRGGSILNLKEIAGRLKCSTQSVARGFRAGRYPFVWKDGHRLLGSEEGLERWVLAKTKGNPNGR